MTVKEIREKRDMSQVEAAVRAGVSVTTWRTYEAAPSAVTAKSRAKCDAALAQMSATAEQAA